MRFDKPLDPILRTQSAIRVLRALDEAPSGYRASGRDVARRAGISHPTATATLEALSQEGVVVAERMLHASTYELNREHVLVGPLTTLFACEREVVDVLKLFLRDEIARRRIPILRAYLFGSVARGDAGLSSDIDVGVVCRPGDAESVGLEMEALGEDVRRRFGNELKVLVRSPRGGAGAARVWKTIASEGQLVFGEGSEDG
jgi:predicted nucleotidyltransferase